MEIWTRTAGKRVRISITEYINYGTVHYFDEKHESIQCTPNEKKIE